MNIVTSWMEEGIEQGKQEEALKFVVRRLARQFGEIESPIKKRLALLSVKQLEELDEASLNFTEIANIREWLDAQ